MCHKKASTNVMSSVEAPRLSCFSNRKYFYTEYQVKITMVGPEDRINETRFESFSHGEKARCW